MSPVHRDGPEHSGELRTKDGRVVKLRLPAGFRREGDIEAVTEAKPKPPQADDPRSSAQRAVPPYDGGS
jgi:hypothetical protein